MLLASQAAAFAATPTYKRGDIDQDGKLTIRDVGALVDMLLLKTAPNLSLADLDCDGRVTVKDLAILIQQLKSPSDDGTLPDVGGEEAGGVKDE